MKKPAEVIYKTSLVAYKLDDPWLDTTTIGKWFCREQAQVAHGHHCKVISSLQKGQRGLVTFISAMIPPFAMVNGGLLKNIPDVTRGKSEAKR